MLSKLPAQQGEPSVKDSMFYAIGTAITSETLLLSCTLECCLIVV